MIKHTNGHLERYYEDCKNGIHVVGYELMTELENLMEDLQGDEYDYDTEDADVRISFIENCIRLTKSPFYGKPMKLLPFQKAFISALYGFKMKDGVDRFQRALFLIARKNGKSELCSALLLTEMCIGGSGLDIVCSSNDDNQADILYQATDTMRLMIDPKSIDTWRNQKCIRCLVNDNRIFKLSDKTRNKEGRNIDIAVIDECFSPDTQLLTEDGFRKISDIYGTDAKVAQWEDGEITFTRPLKWIKKKFNGELYSSPVKCTPSHEFEVIYPNGTCGVKERRNLNTAVKLPRKGIFHGRHLTQTERIAIAIQADGSYEYEITRKSKSGFPIGYFVYNIRFKKEHKISRWIELIEGYPYCREFNAGNGLRGWMVALPYRDAKLLKSIFKYNDADPVEIIEEASHWDSSIRDTRVTYGTIIEDNADFIYTMATLAGYSPSIKCYKDGRGYSDYYQVDISKSWRTDFYHGKTIAYKNSMIPYDGDVYCLVVPTHKVIAKADDGKPIVVRQCHEMKDNVIVKSIEQSQSLKISPKLILISTEGFVNLGFLDNELIRARGILNREIVDLASTRYLVWLYTQDSESEIWQGDRDNRLWEKSNPTLGTVKQYSYLEQQVDIAKTSKADRSFVLSKDFNIKQSNSEAWLMLEDYDYEAVFDLEDFRGSLCVAGVDIAETTDLSCAKVLLMKPNDSKKYIHTMYFIPEGKLDRSDDKGAGAKYEQWARDGILKICAGNYIDTTVIADWFFELYEKYGLRAYKVGYDVRFSTDWLKRMDMYGFDTEMIVQRPDVMNQPMKMVEADLKSRLIVGNNDIDKWCFGNTAIKIDGQGNGLAVKIDGQVSRKIDGAVTTIIVYEVFRRYYNEFMSNLEVR